MVVADGDGRVLWREGDCGVRAWADRLGFVPGSNWREDAVGTNAIGTALVVGRPVQVYSAEHFLVSHHPWTCSAAPVRDPRSGVVLGAVDLSGPVSTVHPSTLALAMTAARLAETELRHAHRWELERLRAVAAGVLAGCRGRALVTDAHGWVAATAGVAPVDRVLLPEALPGACWLPAFGACIAEPVPGGWLIRLDAAESPGPAEVVLDLRGSGPAWLEVSGVGGSWRQRLTPRHAEVLFVLACHPGGRSAVELAEDLFGDAGRAVTVRAEMSRLRRHFAGVLAHRPYRFAESVVVRVEMPVDGPPLSASRAPAVRCYH
ncbi:GAF domain-containing protein [Saccharopolyspora sp. K220]|nr:GAF domain-containing protein [Saccharopolyspora soli]